MSYKLQNEDFEKGLEKEDKKEFGFFKSAIANRGGLIMVLISLAIMSAGYFFLLSNSIDQIVFANNNIKNLEHDIVSFETQIGYLEKVEQEFSAIDNNKIKRTEELVTIGPDLPNIYIQLEEMAHSRGLVVDSINAIAQKDLKNNLGVVKVNMKVSQGNYGSLKAFLGLLENSLRIFDVISVSFPDKVDTFNIELSAYYIK